MRRRPRPGRPRPGTSRRHDGGAQGKHLSGTAEPSEPIAVRPICLPNVRPGCCGAQAMSAPSASRAVETVRGPVELAGLGRTLMHEHVFVLQPEALQNYGHLWGESYWDEEARVADAI